MGKGYSNSATIYILTNDSNDKGNSLYKLLGASISREQKNKIINAATALRDQGLRQGKQQGLFGGEVVGMQRGIFEICGKNVKEGAGIKFIQACTSLCVQEVEALKIILKNLS